MAVWNLLAVVVTLGVGLGSPLAQAETEGAGSADAARFGDRSITSEQLADAYRALPSRVRKSLNETQQLELLENLVLKELLYEEAVRRGIHEDAEVRRRVAETEQRLVLEALNARIASEVVIDDQAVANYYKENQGEFSTGRVRVSHILVRDPDEAEQIHAKAVAAPESFGDLARQHSLDTVSSKKGGDLGFFGRGRMAAEFEEIAFSLRTPGELGPIAKTNYGYHIIRLEERDEGEVRPLAQVRDRIRSMLRRRENERRSLELAERVKAEANLSIDAAVVGATFERVLREPPSVLPGSVHGGGH